MPRRTIKSPAKKPDSVRASVIKKAVKKVIGSGLSARAKAMKAVPPTGGPRV